MLLQSDPLGLDGDSNPYAYDNLLRYTIEMWFEPGYWRSEIGDAAVDSYGDEQAQKFTRCVTTKEANKNCRGQRRGVYTLTDIGMRMSRSSHSRSPPCINIR